MRKLLQQYRTGEGADKKQELDKCLIQPKILPNEQFWICLPNNGLGKTDQTVHTGRSQISQKNKTGFRIEHNAWSKNSCDDVQQKQHAVVTPVGPIDMPQVI